MVSLRPSSWSIGTTTWTEPLPYDFVPTSVAAPVSCSAPARISEALALLPSISTTIGYLLSSSFDSWTSFEPSRSTTETMGPFGTTMFAISTQLVTRPPGFSRRSMMSPFMPCSSSES